MHYKYEAIFENILYLPKLQKSKGISRKEAYSFSVVI